MSTLQDVLGGLAEQTFQDFGLRLVDNASTDGLTEYLRGTAPKTPMIRNPHNRGIAVAHNQGMRLALQAWERLDQRYILLLGTDVVLEPDTLERLVAFLDEHEDVAVVGPLLMKLFEENMLDEALRERVQSDHIASAGQLLSKRFCAVDQRVNEVVTDDTEPQTVFVPPTGCLLVRADALNKIVHEGEQFMDTDFRTEEAFTDLAWRLLRAGYASVVLPDVRAYQFSGVYRAGGPAAPERMLGLRQRDRFLLLAKHVSLGQFLVRFPWIALGEGRVWVRALLKDKQTRSQLSLLGELWKRARVKRKDLKGAMHPPNIVRPFVR